MIKKFSINSKLLEEKYIKDGFLLIKNPFEKKYIDNLSKIILEKLKKFEKKYNDYHDICNKIMDVFEKSPEYDELIFQENIYLIGVVQEQWILHLF